MVEKEENVMKSVPFFFHGILKGRYKNEEEAELYGYELFSRGFNTFKRGDSSIVGTLALVPVEDVPELDTIEGFPNFYIRHKLPVVTKDGTTVMAWVYQQTKDYLTDCYDRMLEDSLKYT